MNDRPLPLGQNSDDVSISLKRKKARQKYAPKACVSCRRSKLKCSGDNPCQRCRDNGKRCFFSEDQTAAEALQTLSRPSLPQQSSTSTSVSRSAQRNIMQTHKNNERRASDDSPLGLSMEARMARIESMMEALLQERAMQTAPLAGLHDRGNGNGNGNDIAMSMTMGDSVNPALAFFGGPTQDTQPRLHDVIDPLLGTDMADVRLGDRSLMFPRPAVYQGYITAFFDGIHAYHPCVDEKRFRSRSQRMLAVSDVHPEDVCFLALNYIIFALHAVSNNTIALDYQGKPPGWCWIQIADKIIGKRQLIGHGDVSLAQFLLFKALYCVLVDHASLAFNTIGLASRYALQHGLNLKSAYTGTDVWDAFERLRTFWNILIADRRMSLSCNRPYVLRDHDIAAERPKDMYSRDIAPLVEPSQSKVARETDEYLEFMVHWSRFAASLWDSVLAPYVHTSNLKNQALTFNAAVHDFIGSTLAPIGKRWSGNPHRHCQYVWLCFDNLMLRALRAIISLPQLEGDLSDLLRHPVMSMSRLGMTKCAPTDTYPLRHQAVTTMTASLHLLSTTLVNNQSLDHVDFHEWTLIEFNDTIDLLDTLAQTVPLAQRVLRDFEKIVPLIRHAMSRIAEETNSFQFTLKTNILASVIPPNAADFLPYGEQVPDIRSPVLYDWMWADDGGCLDAEHGSSAMDAGLESSVARNGVLWV